MNILEIAGAPANGTNEVQIITFGGTITAGAASGFRLRVRGRLTALILWSATDATLIANIQAALNAVLGAGNSLVADLDTTSGIGTVTVTFIGALAATNVGLMVATSALTGTAPTVAVTDSVTGVPATEKSAGRGQLLLDTTNRKLYVNNSTTAGAPDWDPFVKTNAPVAWTPQNANGAIAALNSTAVNPVKTDFDALLAAMEKVNDDLLALKVVLDAAGITTT